MMRFLSIPISLLLVLLCLLSTDHACAQETMELQAQAAGSDAARNKATYPALFGLEETREKAEGTIREALAALAGFDDRADMLRELAQYIISRKR